MGQLMELIHLTASPLTKFVVKESFARTNKRDGFEVTNYPSHHATD